MGRPTKLGSHVVSAFREILSEEMNILACSDRELFGLLNELLPAGGKVSYRTFQRYKAHAMACGAEMEDCETEEEIAALESFDPVYRTMYNLFTLALIKQKKALLHRIIDEEQGWRRYQWLLERKFREWNLRWEPPAEPIPAPVSKADEPDPQREFVLFPERKPEPEVLINGKIPEKEFKKGLYRWAIKNHIMLDEHEVVECRYYDNEPVEYKINSRSGDDMDDLPDGVTEHEYYDKALPGDGLLTVHVWPPLTRQAAA